MPKKFNGKKIYYSSSIQGVSNTDPNLGYKIISFLKKNGAKVLDEHVGARNHTEKVETLKRIAGFDMEKDTEAMYKVRKFDTDMVDKATNLIAIVNGPSHGVGMEIERALLKHQRGLNKTPVLCLVHKNYLNSLTWMVRGIDEEHFNLGVYESLKDIQKLISDFLNVNPPIKKLGRYRETPPLLCPDGRFRAALHKS